MKFAYFLIPLAILISPSFLSAQNNERKLEQDQESRALLELVNKKYHASPSLKLDFSLLVDMPEEESNIKSKGVVYLKNSKEMLKENYKTLNIKLNKNFIKILNTKG